MKSILTAVTILLLFAGCSDKAPSVQVANQRATKANVQFKQVNGNTINQNDVLSGASSALQDVTEGAILVTAVIQNEQVSPTTTFNASHDNNYAIVVLAGDPPVLRVDERSK